MSVSRTTLSAPSKTDGPASVLAPLLKANGFDLAFNILNIGARPIGDADAEPFWQLLDVFPASRIAAVEIDPQLCAELNASAPERVRYYPAAIGRTEERRTVYETANPMCTSLYCPDERYADLYHGLDVMRLKRTSEVTTIGMDSFIAQNGLGGIDFLKIDIQGAELDVFKGGAVALKDTLCIVTEVEFVPLYKDQPLFGDVAACLHASGIMFHKFLGMAGRVMKPLTMHESKNYPARYLWSDAFFARDLLALEKLANDQLLKLATLLDIYESRDAALHVLRRYDLSAGDDLSEIYLAHLVQDETWGVVTTLADKSNELG
ncbi:MAG: hypothetical protein JWN94_3423 [Betaproteobacteria bacterium]|nr:hypothetical protein [Betaproteobacteria bacterium]